MKRLHNIEDRRVLMERMKADSRPRTTLSFYRYVHLDQPERTRAELYEAWSGSKSWPDLRGEGGHQRPNLHAHGTFEEFKATLRDWVGCPTSG